MKELKLKNGSIEVDVTIAAIMMNLEALFAKNKFAFYDLVMKCNNESYEWEYRNSKRVMKNYHLMESDGKILDDIQNVVLSAVEIDGGDMRIVDPIDRN